MNWFRLYSEVVDDSKVQLLEPELFRFWINILCIANNEPKRGTLPSLKQVAFRLRMSPQEAEESLRHLIAEGLVDRLENGTLTPHNWAERQPETDDAAARMRRMREQRRAVTSSFDSDDGMVNSGAKTSDSQVSIDPPVGAEPVTEPVPNAFGTSSEEVRSRLEERRLEERRLEEKSAARAHARNEPVRNQFGTSSEPASSPLATLGTPEEVAAVEAYANDMFPLTMMSRDAREACKLYPAHWVHEALEITAGKGHQRWSYVKGVLKQFKAQGGSDSEIKARNGPPPRKSRTFVDDRTQAEKDALRDSLPEL